MFAKKVTNSDVFLDMPLSTQALYFHLNMESDDDGFNGSPKKVQRMIGASDDDLKLLLAKGFVIPFESGVVVIRHWKIHNYIQKDRYKETIYLDEKNMLKTMENKTYSLMDTNCIQNGYTGKVRKELGKSKESIELYNNIVIKNDSVINSYNKNNSVINAITKITDNENENKKENKKEKYGKYSRVKLTSKEYLNLCNEFGKDFIDRQIILLDEYVESNNNKNKYTNFNLVLRKSIRDNWFKQKEERRTSNVFMDIMLDDYENN